MKKIALWCMMVHLSVAAWSQAAGSISGTWMGKIESGGQSFRMVLHIKSDSNRVVCTLDSPDQGALNLPTKGASFIANALKVDASNLGASYHGDMQAGDTLITGYWIQDGSSFRLDLSRQDKAVTLNRPQEPVAPFPYTSAHVTIDNIAGRSQLSGTVVIPKGVGTFPAVVLLSDIGPHNQDGEVMGHKPFWVIADYLARNGIASIRFDDRGVGKSSGNFKAGTTVDFAGDAAAAFKLLYSNPKVSKKKVGIIGHGEGGVVGAIVASAEPKVSFVVLLASLGLSGEEVLIQQARAISNASGLPASAAIEAEQTNRAMYEIIKREPDNSKAVTELTALAWKIANNQQSLSVEEKNNVVEGISKSFSAILTPWYRSFLVLDPAVYYSKVKVPVLALCGAHDLEVNAQANLPAIEAALRDAGNANFKVLKLDDLNHLFQHCKTGLPAEYGTIEETISPDVLRVVKDWIKNEATVTIQK